MNEKYYKAIVHFDKQTFDVFNCKTIEDAQKQAEEMAQDLAECMGFEASIHHVEVFET